MGEALWESEEVVVEEAWRESREVVVDTGCWRVWNQCPRAGSSVHHQNASGFYIFHDGVFVVSGFFR